MFVPIRDYNPIKTIPFQYVTVLLILANVVIFAFSIATTNQALIASFAVVPEELFSEGFGTPINTERFDYLPVPERWTLLSYMFLHGDILHIFGNMLFLWVFGDNVEDAMGHAKFLIFYLLCGVFAAMTHAWVYPQSPAPLIGASGAVAGVVAAYLMLHPKVRMWVLVFRVIPMQISAMWALGAWILMQFVLVLAPNDQGVAWWAHIGGLAAGFVLILFLRRPGVPLFDQGDGMGR